jgi:hypothetical protein
MSLARTAQDGTHIAWANGGPLPNGCQLGLGDGLLLWHATLACRVLLALCMSPGASKVASGRSRAGGARLARQLLLVLLLAEVSEAPLGPLLLFEVVEVCWASSDLYSGECLWKTWPALSATFGSTDH